MVLVCLVLVVRLVNGGRVFVLRFLRTGLVARIRLLEVRCVLLVCHCLL